MKVKSFKMTWTNNLVLEFLALYESEPVIWDPKHFTENKRKDSAAAWKRIAFAMSSKFSIKELKKKKESLMSIYRAIYVKEKKISDVTGNVYKPNWFAYQTMNQFLQNVYQPRVLNNSKEDNNEWTSPHNSADQGIEHLSESPQHFKTDSSASTSASIVQTQNHRSKKRKKTSKKHGGAVYDILKNLCDTKEKDDCALFGELLAMKLRNFDENTREVVMNEIDNLVFRVKMNLKKDFSLSQRNSSAEAVYPDQCSVQDNTKNSEFTETNFHTNDFN